METGGQTTGQDQRGRWKSQTGFVLAAIGSAVGLGNIWRFSYMAYDNGGAAFLVPYVLALFLAGIPLMILEYSVGHRLQGSSALVFAKINPKWEWLGWWMPLCATFGIMIYYAAVIGWCLNYTILSFGQEWGADTNTFFFQEFLRMGDATHFSPGAPIFKILVATAVVWLLCWLICYLGVERGIEIACKIFMPLLLVLTLILVARGLTLPGAKMGIKAYLHPDWTKLRNPKVWADAFSQIFFTLSLGFGIMIAYASYLPKKTRLTTNALITSFGNCLYSFIAGFAVFSVLGFMATQKELPISEVAAQSVGLAFVTYPEAVSSLPGLNAVFGICFFAALTIAGLSSGISLVEAMAAAVHDKFRVSKRRVVTIVCSLGFLGSIIFTTPAGLLWLDVVDHFVTNFGLVTGGLLECLVVGWIFKAKILRRHVNESGSYLPWIWDLLVKFVTPLVLLTILELRIYGLIREGYGGYGWDVLILVGFQVIIATLLAGFFFASVPWDKRKLQDVHKPDEDKLLV